ncbi:alpha/beta fold hydrolase [Lysinibacillus antri]|uniref:Alpha/beta fold hydrolase n=2 Tax=Bacillaceae TaxID=186817 RepID=A0A432L7H5_9BACI|nr:MULTISPECIES: carboxylesterase [Lysinibacillus]RUL47219.1 alpha/beta fold hydrolase [Lysinibacillus antri]TSI04652.1 alpha/beta fold hydrolase [Lysinibacillus sp. BW-2-10]
MRNAELKPFFFEAGKRAVLLLHGFTGSSSDVRILGRFLEKNGYTCHAPHYKGHGVPPEQLIETAPNDWWKDVLQGYETLKEAGYTEIAVAGLSLGGVFSLKLSMEKPLKGIVTMCSPMTMRTTDKMFEGVIKYAYDYKRFEGKDEVQIEQEIEAIRTKGMPSLPELQQLVVNVRSELDMIYAPILVVQSKNDEVIDPNSAHIIYDEVESLKKEIKWFEHSKHVITLDQEKQQLHETVLNFLESLDWEA